MRQYLMDGEPMSRAWSLERIRASEALLAERGVGLWLAREKLGQSIVGFCGFLILDSLHGEPQLVYALPRELTGRGYATEMAQAMIAAARSQPGFETIHAAVDAPNVRSIRVLQKLGFRQTGTAPGAFDEQLLFHLDSR